MRGRSCGSGSKRPLIRPSVPTGAPSPSGGRLFAIQMRNTRRNRPGSAQTLVVSATAQAARRRCTAFGSFPRPTRQRVAKRNAREQKHADPPLHPVRPPQSLCGDRALRGSGPAQGRRGHRRPPDRFARPPSHERAARMGRPFVKAFFLLDRPRPVLFLTLSKRERGAESPGLSRPPRRGRSPPGPSRPPRRGRSPPETSQPSQPSWAIFRPMRVPMTEAIISPRVQPELSPRQWSPWRLVLKSVSIFTRLE